MLIEVADARVLVRVCCWRGVLVRGRWWGVSDGGGMLETGRWWRGVLVRSRWWGDVGRGRWWGISDRGGMLETGRWWRGVLVRNCWWRGCW